MSVWNSEISPERRSARLKMLMVSTLIGFLIIVGRLVNIQIVHHQHYSDVACNQHTTLIDVEARRGRILDRNGYLLAGNRAVATFQIYWPEVPSEGIVLIDSLVRKLGEYSLVDFPAERRSGNQILAIDVPYQDAIVLMNSGLPPGVSVNVNQERTYPMGDIGAGIVGRFTAENSEGIEAWFNSDLQGIDGRLFIEKSATGRYNLTDPDADNTPAVDGQDIMLTIDARFQCIIMEELEIATDRFNCDWAAAVLVDPASGEVLAAGSVPVRAENGSLAMNHCFQGYHEPGSTFKIVAYAACIEEGLINEDDMFNCSDGFISVADHNISDAHEMGILTRDEILINSSNVGTVMLSRFLSDTTLCQYCSRFGFGLQTMIEYPDESRGILPYPGSPGWSGVSSAQIAIGQEVTVTPIQLALAYSVIANGGTLYYPRLLEASLDGDQWMSEESIVRSHPLSHETAETVRRTLRAVVEEGTGASAAVDGVAVGGKTGTAERLSGDSDYLSAFVGMVPADNPSFVLAVIIDGPDYEYRWGSASAAPVFSDITSRILAVEPELALGHRVGNRNLMAGVIE
ncbi:MAG: penicillin-binding protein 2 [Candidatus Aegiribacteria sp.]|nr:penicillin-binding protein 2 [Candidatus Aegiribacteria sp.]